MKQSMILLHGLFGQLSNWDSVVEQFGVSYNVYVPALPIYDTPKDESLFFLLEFLEGFIKDNDLKNVILVGNSLGGHVAILYASRHSYNVKNLILTGSSGLYENTNMGSFPKRSTAAYIKARVEYTFHDPAIATEALISQVLSITVDSQKCLSVLRVAKSAQRHYVADLLPQISAPTLLIWGRDDRITPIHVAREFAGMIPDTKLVILNECGHAPMMEKPEEFNFALQHYLHEGITK
ncbi:alpha/beta fold hydrolase [Chitinophaga filiformis]|uniref:Pimeloyl-ACP methyl ester carboxylesterase n=1 Tax=Chitinophaga filiformis TaxID=104663 RepID=A0A1G7VIU7_CHIFI|nr:alpha/beta fold hydrolase [Chitinophaga filiformis]SDG59617.1 Pimeloyl-ACP methyl ester carboxylesterase [Chitinophaga filiformis]